MAERFQLFAGSFIGLDAPASSALTRELLGWQPTQPGLIEDLDKGHYFDHLADTGAVTRSRSG